MDRSFLSRPEIIAASRQFVCVRLTTYENKEEAEFLKAFHVTRSGEVENTVFTILAPDGQRQLARASRSARGTFADAHDMADTMERISRAVETKAPAANLPPELPSVRNLRLAVDVAACDNRPLVVVFATQMKERRDLEERVAALAWGERFLGRFIYVVVSDPKELAGVEGVKAHPGVFVLQPDRFGQKATVLKQIGAAAGRAELATCLDDGVALFKGADKTFANHVWDGQRQGAFWETALPVTDPMERQARERGRRP